jgi:Flp pilus assembly protein TadG
MRGRRFGVLVRRFHRAEQGIAAIEFAFLAPVLILLLLGCVTLFILFRNSAAAENATFTVADIVSREVEVTNAKLEIDRGLFVAMLADSSATVGLRISSVKRTLGVYTVDWSYAVSPQVKMTVDTIPVADMPLVTDGDSVVIVESTVTYTPLFAYVGLSGGTYANIAMNRPRFTSAVAKTD